MNSKFYDYIHRATAMVEALLPFDGAPSNSTSTFPNKNDMGSLAQIELTSDYKELLKDLTETLQENFRRAFKNEAINIQRRKSLIKTVHKLDTILLSLDQTKIELTDLKLLWLPDFRLVNFQIDLPRLNLDLELKLGDLRVEGIYEVNNLALQRLLPVTHSGKVIIDFSNVTCKGRVGLDIQGDSFVPLNYDVKYRWEQTEVTVIEKQVQNKITQTKDEKSIGDAIWLQLDGLLTQLLHEQLATVITEYSVAESLADEDQQLKDYSESQSSKANALFDSLLCAAKDFLVAKDLRVIETPGYNVVYKGSSSHFEQGVFETDSGYLRDLSSLSRLQDASIYEDDYQICVYGYIGLRDFKHGYQHFKSKFEDTEVEGTIKGAIHQSKILIKILEDKNNPNEKKKLEMVKTKVLGDIDVDTSGLASLSWLVPQIQSWTIGHFRISGIAVLEETIKEAFTHAIDLEWKRNHQVTDVDVPDNYKLEFWKNVFIRNTFR